MNKYYAFIDWIEEKKILPLWLINIINPFPYFSLYLLVDLKGLTLKEKLTKIICRFRKHPDGCVYYNPSGLEPDWSCKNCGDDL